MLCQAQPPKSKKDGKKTWAMIEMWPMIVSIHYFVPSGVMLGHTHRACFNILIVQSDGCVRTAFMLSDSQ